MNRCAKALCAVVAVVFAFPGGAALPLLADEGPAINPVIYKVPAHAKTIDVDCDAKQTLAGALADGAPDLNIVFSGTCKEYVYIQRDGVAIRGKDAGATLAGAIEVTAAKRILLEGFTCRDNTQLEYCIGAVQGSNVILHNLKVFNSSVRGVSVFNSTALIDGLTVDKTVSTSIVVRGSHVRVEGEVNFSNTIEGCMVVDGTSSVFSKNAVITARDCMAGIIVQTNSSFLGPFGTLNLNHNTFVGLALISHGSFSYGGTINAKNNTQAGIFVDEESSFAPFSNLLGSSSVNLENNGMANLYLARRSTAELANANTSTGSTYGVYVDDSSVRIVHSKISGNKKSDLRLQFGAHATLADGAVIGNSSCDGSQLLRGAKTPCTVDAVAMPSVAKPAAGKSEGH
jgi:hypothetical protein